VPIPLAVLDKVEKGRQLQVICAMYRIFDWFKGNWKTCASRIAAEIPGMKARTVQRTMGELRDLNLIHFDDPVPGVPAAYDVQLVIGYLDDPPPKKKSAASSTKENAPSDETDPTKEVTDPTTRMTEAATEETQGASKMTSNTESLQGSSQHSPQGLPAKGDGESEGEVQKAQEGNATAVSVTKTPDAASNLTHPTVPPVIAAGLRQKLKRAEAEVVFHERQGDTGRASHWQVKVDNLRRQLGMS
jgi:hypothetical protein